MVHELPRQLFVSLLSLNHLKSRNLAFYSTNVVEVTGTWLVIKTGDETVMGCIARLGQDSHQQGGELKLVEFCANMPPL